MNEEKKLEKGICFECGKYLVDTSSFGYHVYCARIVAERITKEDQSYPPATESQIAAYTNLFNFFYNEHGLTLLHEEMDGIIRAVDQFKKEYNK